MATKREPAAPIGAIIENVHIENKASQPTDRVADAMIALDKAYEENEIALGKMADSLKGAEAHMQYGINLSDVKGA
jgi:hypothetical protein